MITHNVSVTYRSTSTNHVPILLCGFSSGGGAAWGERVGKGGDERGRGERGKMRGRKDEVKIKVNEKKLHRRGAGMESGGLIWEKEGVVEKEVKERNSSKE